MSGSLIILQSNSHNSLRSCKDHGGDGFSCAEVAIKIKKTDTYNIFVAYFFLDRHKLALSVKTDKNSVPKTVHTDSPAVAPKYDPIDAAAPNDASGDHRAGGGFIFIGEFTLNIVLSINNMVKFVALFLVKEFFLLLA